MSFRVAANVGLSQVSILVTLKTETVAHADLFILAYSAANMDIKFLTKTKLYAKNNHTFYNVTQCKGELTGQQIIYDSYI